MLGAVSSFLLIGLITLPVSSAFAHHSVRSNFEMDTTIEVEGTITSVAIRNPHSQYVMEVQGEDGNSEEWLIEWSDRNALIRRKVSIDRIKVGDRIRVTLWPSKRLKQVGYFIQAVLPDGSIFRDCGFAEFRAAVVSSTEYTCEEAAGE
jgi:hypothetical protein